MLLRRGQPGNKRLLTHFIHECEKLSLCLEALATISKVRVMLYSYPLGYKLLFLTFILTFIIPKICMASVSYIFLHNCYIATFSYVTYYYVSCTALFM